MLQLSGGIQRLFDKWTDAGAQDRFKARLDRYGSIWCCINGHPGHIWCAPGIALGSRRAWCRRRALHGPLPALLPALPSS